MKTRFFFIVLSIVIGTSSFGQSFVGHTVDNYAGVHSVIYNPSNVISTELRAEINLFAASVFAGSDYLGVDLSNVLNTLDDIELTDDSEKFPNNANEFYFNVDVLGPSFMFNINDKNSVGLITRLRGQANLFNVNGELFELIVEDFGSDTSVDFDMQDVSGTVHAWAEIGLVYGRVILDQPKHRLKGGVTLKYLQGAGSTFLNSPGLNGQFLPVTETLTTQGTLEYGFTDGFDSNDINFSNITSSFGMDIGFTYQWHRDRKSGRLRGYDSPYQLKIGVSVTDIGSINYEDSTIKNYDLNATVSTADYEGNLERFLDENYQNVETVQTSRISLPTALHVLIDYRLSNNFLVSAQADLSMQSREEAFSNAVLNTMTLVPRYESKWLSLYAPLSFRQYNDIASGLGLRLGPLTVGSGSIITNLLSNNSKTLDLFMGLSIPLYKNTN